MLVGRSVREFLRANDVNASGGAPEANAAMVRVICAKNG